MHVKNLDTEKWMPVALKVMAVAVALALRALDKKSGNGSVRESGIYRKSSYGLLLLNEQGELLSRQSISPENLLQGSKAMDQVLKQVRAVQPAKAVLVVRSKHTGIELIAKHDEVVRLMERLLSEVDVRLVNQVLSP